MFIANCSREVSCLFFFVCFLPSLLGKDTEPGESGVFPLDPVVAVGSDLTFCCVHEEDQRITNMTYGSKSYTMMQLSSRSHAIRVLNANVSNSSGTNVVCRLENAWEGSVVFVGCM